MKNFKFIVLEGIDRSGKSTVASLLNERLKPSILMGFPNRNTETGKLLDKFLKKEIVLSKTTTHLLYSANRYEDEEKIRKNLEIGHVICDRYWLSGTVYSTAKGLDYEWCKQVDKNLPIADYTFFIDVKSDEASKRSEFGKEFHDREDFQKKVYDIYRSKAEEEGVCIIDGMQEPERIVEKILKTIL